MEDEDVELARIERRLELLPAATRTVFLLARLDDLSNEHIAWRLGLDAKRNRAGPCAGIHRLVH